MDLPTNLLAIAGFLLPLFLLYKQWKPWTENPNRNPKSAPEAAGGLPVIGHLLQLNSHNTLARTLAAMADKYGPVFKIRIGSNPYLVVSNWETVKESFTTNDKALASRPKTTHGLYLGYNYAGFGFAPYGPFWREMRKIVSVEVLSGRRLETLRHVRRAEIEISIGELFSRVNPNPNKSSVKVVMSEWFEKLTLNLIMRTIAGKRYSETEAAAKIGAQRFNGVVKDFMKVSGEYALSDIIRVPAFLRWVDLLGPAKSMKRISKELDAITQIWIDEHTGKMPERKNGNEQDFIDVMLSVIKDDFVFGHARETIIKATIQNLILAGSDTTSIHLTWILCLLLNNESSMRKAQEEIDKNVGKQRWVEESDIKNLVYLQAIVKETLRLYPPGPLSVPHLAREDIEVSGYHVPKGTRLLVNVWKLHRDPRIWSEPDKFSPERFMTGHPEVDFSGLHFEFIPFGSGRRACPGMTFAMQVTHVTIARLLQGFEFAKPSNMAVDMAEGQGITLPKMNPLEVLVRPRLDDALYMGH